MQVLGKPMTGEKIGAGVSFLIPIVTSGAVSLANHWNYDLAPWVWTLYTWVYFISIAAFFVFLLHITWAYLTENGYTGPQRSGAIALIVVVVGLLVGAIAGWGLVKRPPSPSATQPEQPTPQHLSYRLCGIFRNVPNTHRKEAFSIEIDPFNPNNEDVHVDVTSSLLIFDGVPSKLDLSQGHGFNVSPQAKLTPKSTIANQKDFVFFKPPRKLTGVRSGRYHYEFKFGWDKNTAIYPFVIDGTVFATFGSNGVIIGVPYFTPSGDSNVTFDPTRCKWYMGEDPDNGKDSPGEV